MTAPLLTDRDLLRIHTDAYCRAYTDDMSDDEAQAERALAGLRAVERAARAAEREALIAEADATVAKLRALHRTTMGYEDACVARGAELVADALRARATEQSNG